MNRELEFERPLLRLERQIEVLKRQSASDSEAPRKSKRKVPLEDQLERLESEAARLRVQIFAHLTPWQTVQVARHPGRPFTLDYAALAFTDFSELHGDRGFGDDPSIVGGLARLRGESVMLVGHQKGRTTQENLHRNFGMPKPEGYRKALRLMRVAERFRLPVVTLIDTPGAYPGLDAEERGQAQAIAESLEGMAALRIPIVSVVIGEGGSGGALAIGVANRVFMLEHAVYSVISPEGCASILFKDAAHAERAADALKLTAKDLHGFGVVDGIIAEPPGGAHRDHPAVAARLADQVQASLSQLQALSADALIEDRYRRLRALGSVTSALIENSSGKMRAG